MQARSRGKAAKRAIEELRSEKNSWLCRKHKLSFHGWNWLTSKQATHLNARTHVCVCGCTYVIVVGSATAWWAAHLPGPAWLSFLPSNVHYFSRNKFLHVLLLSLLPCGTTAMPNLSCYYVGRWRWAAIVALCPVPLRVMPMVGS